MKSWSLLPMWFTLFTFFAGSSQAKFDSQQEELVARIKAEVLAELQAKEDKVEPVKEEPVKETVQPLTPKLNFVELEGYYRLRTVFGNNWHLQTFVPGLNVGTSTIPPPITYFNPTNQAQNDAQTGTTTTGQNSLFTTNMRLRLQPILNVSEDIRIKSTIDVLDNLVLGSTPMYMARGDNVSSPMYNIGLLSLSQNPPIVGINSPFGSIAVKRLWGEVTFPFGELRFGRMPFQVGLGILYNNGNGINDDYGDNLDGLLFAARIGEFYLIPGYSIALSGPTGRGGGAGRAGDNGLPYFPGEWGQRIDLDPSDNVHTFLLTFAKKDSEETIQQRLMQNEAVFNYGFFGSYRFQLKDSQYASFRVGEPVYELAKNMRTRNANLGIGSLWAGLFWDTLQVEVELAGVLGKIGYTKGHDFPWLDTDTSKPVWLVQGGWALKTRYGFLNNRLGTGVDAGMASGGKNSGFGLRPGINQNPQAGYFDGQQVNTGMDTHFRFNPNYYIDLLLFREILGTVTNATYIKPHIDYSLTDGLKVKGDLIFSFANSPDRTPGKSRMLGIEFDATLSYRTVDGFFFMLQYGLLVPLAGLNHTKDFLTSLDPQNGASLFNTYGTARVAQTVQGFFGIEF